MPCGLAGEELGREVAERADHLRADQLDLGEQVALARLDLVGQRVAVPGRAALEHVGDVDVRRARARSSGAARSSSFPAWPTNGTPCLSSWNPGASPTNIRSASGSPVPTTTWVREAESAHLVQPRHSSASRSSSTARAGASLTDRILASGPDDSVQWPQPQLPPQQPPPPPPPTVAPTGRGVANDDRSFVTVPLPHAGQWTVAGARRRHELLERVRAVGAQVLVDGHRADSSAVQHWGLTPLLRRWRNPAAQSHAKPHRGHRRGSRGQRRRRAPRSRGVRPRRGGAARRHAARLLRDSRRRHRRRVRAHSRPASPPTPRSSTSRARRACMRSTRPRGRRPASTRPDHLARPRARTSSRAPTAPSPATGTSEPASRATSASSRSRSPTR